MIQCKKDCERIKAEYDKVEADLANARTINDPKKIEKLQKKETTVLTRAQSLEGNYNAQSDKLQGATVEYYEIHMPQVMNVRDGGGDVMMTRTLKDLRLTE